MNTIQAARKQAGISQQELAIQADVSRHSILRLEQLCYPTPLPNVVNTLSDITGLSEYSLRENYARDVEANRAINGELWFRASPEYAQMIAEAAINHVSRGGAGASHSHVFEVWRRSMCAQLGLPDSQIHFCQMFSVHPSVVNRYETFKTKFPQAIEDAFIVGGCSEELLKLFKTSPLFNQVVR